MKRLIAHTATAVGFLALICAVGAFDGGQTGMGLVLTLGFAGASGFIGGLVALAWEEE